MQLSPSAPAPIVRRKDSIRVAAVQTLVPAGVDPVAPTLEYLRKASEAACDLVVLPEYHLGHIQVDGPVVAALQTACRDLKLNLVVGAWLDRPGQRSLNAALVIDREGKLLGHYDKMHAAVGRDPYSWPPLGHEEEWHMELGATFPTYDLDFGRIGVMTCYDGYFPEVPRCLSLNGAEVIAWINGRYGCVEDYLVQGYCFTNFVHIVATNQSTGPGTQVGHFPDRILSITREPNQEAMLVEELDLAMLRKHRVHARMFHQRRPELYGALTQKHEIWKNYPDIQAPPTIEELLVARDASMAGPKQQA